MSEKLIPAKPLPWSSSTKSPRKSSWQVRLGQIEWRRHTYERSPEDAIELLGSIRKGSQLGALARKSDGQYVLIVGDHETPLNTGQMEKAMAKATKDPAGQVKPEPRATWTVPKVDAPAPTVIVKKRRTIRPVP
jgi:hypothetical protein